MSRISRPYGRSGLAACARGDFRGPNESHCPGSRLALFIDPEANFFFEYGQGDGTQAQNKIVK